jgi:CheY-like chemotaxis protein
MIKKLKMLLVEDQEMNRACAKSMFEIAGYEVEALDSARAAKNRIERGRRYDVVLTDLSVEAGEWDGCKLAGLVRNYDTHEHKTKVILFSGMRGSTLRDIVDEMELELDGFVSKLTESRDVVAYVNEICMSGHEGKK